MSSAKSKQRTPSAVPIPDFRLLDDRVFLLLILAAALFIRLDFLIANNFVIDSDEAIVGLMAKHILEGRGIPAFYYGQHYMGSFEPIVTALIFMVAGISSASLKFVPLLFSIIFILLLYQLGLELGGRAVARLAALFAALPPQLLVLWSSMARGGYMEILCIGTLASILLLRWLRSSRPTFGQTAALAGTLGFGWWVNNQIVFFVLPIAFFAAAALYASHKQSPGELWRSFAKHAGTAAAAFLIAGAPFWLYNIKNDFASFQIAQTAAPWDVFEHMRGLVEASIPMLLGARRQWHRLDVFPAASLVVYLFYFVLLGIVLWKRRFALSALLRFQVSRREPVEYFLLLLLAIFTVFLVSKYGSLTQSPRYLLPAYVSIFILSACSVSIIAARHRGLGSLAALAIVSISLLSCYLGGRALPGEPFVVEGERVAKDHRELIAWLREHEIDFVRTNYWIGYRLAFETHEDVRFTVLHTPEDIRIAQYEAEAKRRGVTYLPLIVVPAQAKILELALNTQGITYHKAHRSGYEVLYDLKPSQLELIPIDRALLLAEVTHGAGSAYSALDGNVGSRWGSGTPQQPGMQYRVRFKSPQNLRGLRYELGSWVHDQPRELEIELELTNGSRRKILASSAWEAVRYFREEETAMLFTFAPAPVRQVILTQTGTQRIFDWSIAELELYK